MNHVNPSLAEQAAARYNIKSSDIDYREVDWSWRLLKSESGESNIIADLYSLWFDLIQLVSGLRATKVLGNLATRIPVRKRPKQQVLGFEKVKVEMEEYSAVLFHLSNGTPGFFNTCRACNGRKADTECKIYGSACSYAWNHREAMQLKIQFRD